MWKKIILSLLVAFVPVFWVQSNRIFELDKDVVYHHTEKCKVVGIDKNIVDFDEFDSEELIAAECDMSSIFGSGPDTASRGRLLRVLDLAYGAPKFVEIQLSGFPSDIWFFPFGIFYQDNTIYVLNQAFNHGGSRVEVFIYSNFRAIYKGSILLDTQVGGTFGDLVIHNENIYLSQYSSIPLEQNSKPYPFTSVIKSFYQNIVQQHEAGVYKCPFKLNSFTNCTIEATEKSHSIPSIIKDRENNIIVSFSSIDYNKVAVYTITPRGGLSYDSRISLRDRAERLFYSKTFGKIYGSAIPWPMMIFSGNTPAGAIEINKEQGKAYTHRRLFMQEKDIKGIKAVARVGNYVLSTGFMENAAYVCLVVDS
ncbi:hypothetical protein SteCoe_26691 [Stentor coeruleus]|uniref:6-bladed beta-propeller n=1 Tax=Stentor coeruleus TaxID=5963 RepID=A0A1R2BCA0_9CILI|nr:hypothetical protein SteCoe_26691 [Stentor coeruleus]